MFLKNNLYTCRPLSFDNTFSKPIFVTALLNGTMALADYSPETFTREDVKAIAVEINSQASRYILWIK